MVRPRNNLPPESQPWSRAIEDELQQTQRGSSKALEDNTNAFKGLNSSMKAISDQITSLATQQAALTATQATLTSQQATLTSQQATLTGQVASIAALVSAQLSPAVGNATTGVTPVATSINLSNHAAVTFTVPSGYTKAAVIGVSHISSIVRAHTCATFIDGVVGDYLEVWPDEAGGSTHTRILTGLTGGGTFSVGTQVRANLSGGYVHAMTSAQVTFYR